MKTLITSILLLFLMGCEYSNSRNIHIEPHIDRYEAYQLNATKNKLITGWYRLSKEPNDFMRSYHDPYSARDIFYIDPKPIVNITDFYSVDISKQTYQDEGLDVYSLSIELIPESHEIWAEATRNNIREQIAFILDDRLICAPIVTAEIENGMSMITTNWTLEEIENVKERLQNTVIEP